jgi:hypothetical protein
VVQDAAYATMLRGRRQQLRAHCRVLESRFPEIAATQLELLRTVHGSSLTKAVDYWVKPGGML